MGLRIYLSMLVASLLAAQPRVPRAWDEQGFVGWQLPIVGQKFTTGHFTEEEYYGAPVENVRTYPVYAPDREPKGYWDFLNSIGPKPLVEPGKLKTERDWIEAGRRVFEELDFVASRRYDTELIRKLRSRAYVAERSIEPLPDGTMPYIRWVVTQKGVAIALRECAGCHLRWAPGPAPGGKPYHGAPENMPFPNFDFSFVDLGAGVYLPQGDDAPAIRWRSHSVPWIPNDIHARIKTMTNQEWGAWDDASNGMGMAARWDGSIYYPTKIPDLIGIKDRKFFDHTATHRHRGIEDLMRYAAQVMSADSPHFGPYDIVPRTGRRVPYRLSDEALYALALYIYSLEPPPNPNRFDTAAAAGQKIFTVNCARCHTPPLYTNNKLTLARGFLPDGSSPDVMPVSVGTDPAGAMLTRKGTGYYKVPSLKGVWYRGRLLHDGSLASLEEFFNPARLRPDFEPAGWNPVGVKRRAVVGHEFGLKLSVQERAQLIAFLKTL
ncbi:MAG: hypothetical protein LAQ69_01000 [Acidobacteriia bacterium]|nr:hypothetical protein [Terriglobia bacterium]